MAIERDREVRRRKHRKRKLRKLRARLAAASNKAEKDKIVTKIHKISLYAPVEGK